MKATGIVRRIDARVIIRQKPTNRITTGVFNDFCPKISSKTLNFVDLIRQKARWIDILYIHRTIKNINM